MDEMERRTQQVRRCNRWQGESSLARVVRGGPGGLPLRSATHFNSAAYKSVQQCGHAWSTTHAKCKLLAGVQPFFMYVLTSVAVAYPGFHIEGYKILAGHSR